ncbi:glutathione S-transferase family protein [Sandarakinorhabdus sp. DWP1-3-1]|uniref:glutathione S-transferase family protein n=1 Tax=Sandarakinorhabdus sp. DWP1-3-1 TaxID=2804627 RepID=UPI003CF7B29A
MKLWHCRDARSFRVLWTLEELQLEYELVSLPFPPRWREPAYLETNPLGTIPYFEDGPAKMTESAAICEYLAVKYGGDLAVRAEEDDFGAWLNWLHHGEATLTFPQTLVFRYLTLEREENRNPKVAGDYRKWFVARTVLAERTLADGRDYLCAGRFTVADISVAYALQFAETLGHLGELGPNLQAYWERLQERDGFKRAKTAQA